MRGAWCLASSNEGRSHASLKGHTPLPVADGPMVARAELNTVRSVAHCRAVVQLPVAAGQRIRDGQVNGRFSPSVGRSCGALAMSAQV